MNNSQTSPAKGSSCNQTAATASHVVTLEVKGVQVPSFKNAKRAIKDRHTGKMRTLTEGKVKKRMNQIEASIELALYSECQTGDAETDLEWLKRLRTALSGLSDDSVKEIPKSSFDVEYVTKGNEGVQIIIEKLA